MPALPKTSSSDILAAARAIVDRDGAEALSMQAVAVAVGVRAPSLYKHFADRASLLGALRGVVALEICDACTVFGRSADPARGLIEFARAQRTYARSFPRLYGLIMNAEPGSDLDPALNVQLLGPLFVLVRKLSPRRAGDAARLLVAYVHGFASMEIAGAFRLGGDLDASFEFGLRRIVHSLKTAK